ncbi:MAG: thymidine phosphorylase [Deltaproteobacteria bacterium]|nr:thymidine phosphorylase [Deltaproteobacteria bacterium]
MIPTEVIRRKRDRERLPPDEVRDFVRAYTKGEVPDYQAAALVMAIYLNGLHADELHALTEAMLRSGEVLDLAAIPGVKVDKHSTGGVGDKLSLPLAPAVAACGVAVPMVSGRGLGHTGGTLDKLEAIPGFRVDLEVPRFIAQVRDLGLCLIGQTATLAPADRKLYALRDATATVDSIPLIASSIMSKKLAEGIDALVLDVKVGRGAFMKTEARARELAQTMCAIGQGHGKRVVAYLTNMDQPLGLAIGNATEAIESFEVLKGRGPGDVRELTLVLGAEMLVLGGVAADLADGRRRIGAALDDGAALERMRRCVAAQGGDPRAVDDYGRLPTARRRHDVGARAAGYVTAIDAEGVGVAAMRLGAGRQKKEDAVDPAVGIALAKKLGDPVAPGEPLATLLMNDVGPEPAAALVQAAYCIGPAPPAARPLVLGEIR